MHFDHTPVIPVPSRLMLNSLVYILHSPDPTIHARSKIMLLKPGVLMLSVCFNTLCTGKLALIHMTCSGCTVSIVDIIGCICIE